MFERRKIKKLLSQIIQAENDHEKFEIIAKIKEYGKIAFPYVIEAVHEKLFDPISAKNLLEKILDKSYVDEIISMTGDSYDVVRGIGKELISKRIKEEAIPKLIENLQSPNMYLRVSARDLLSSLKNRNSVPKIISFYKTSDDKNLKKIIIGILAKIGDPGCSSLLISALKDKEWSVRIMAVKALGIIKDPKSVDPLIEILYEKDPQIIKGVLDALLPICDKRAARPILPFLKNEDIIIRQKAMENIIRIGDVSLVSDIIVLLREKDVNLRRCAVEILNKLQDPRVADELIKSIKDSDWWVREIATEALTEIKGKNITNAMIIMLKDEDESVRRCAVEFFNKITTKDALMPLIEVLKDEDWWVREKAVTALGKIKDQRAIKPLAAMINDEEVKWAVPSALAAIGEKDLTKQLLPFLEDAQKRVRVETLKVFGRLKEKETVSYIKVALNDPEEEVRNEAIEALKSITGKVFKAVSPSIDKGSEKDSPTLWPKNNMRLTGDVGLNVAEGAILTEAILVVDLCNSTAIADKYGNQFALNLSKILDEKALKLARQESMHYMKSTGDGFLITFPKVENAAIFSISLLSDIKEYNKTVDSPNIINLRFSINMGETRIAPKGDRLGLAVNMAFRIEGVKTSDLIEVKGGIKKEQLPSCNRILITENVVADAEAMEGVTTRLIGLFELKGISGFHRVFELLSVDRLLRN